MKNRATVLVVEDTPDLANLYATWLEPDYEVSTATDAATGLELVDAETQIVLLDRVLPDRHGDDVLQRIRERSLGCSVVMLTGIEPGLDLIDLPVDDYLTKPVTSTALQETITRIRRRRAYDDELGRWLALMSKRATLKEAFGTDALQTNPAYQALLDEIEAQRPDVQTVRASLDDSGAVALFTEQ